jgi:hypothetical protein
MGTKPELPAVERPAAGAEGSLEGMAEEAPAEGIRAPEEDESY